MATSRADIYRAIDAERERQAAKFPRQEPFQVDDFEKATVLVEEMLEFQELMTKAMLGVIRRVNDKDGYEELRKELLQTVTVGVKWLEVL